LITLLVSQSAFARTYGRAVDDRATSITRLSGGGYAVAGWTMASGFFDVLVMKLDNNGNLGWAERFGGSQDDYARCVIQTYDGNLVVSGTGQASGADNQFFVLKTDTLGSLIWARRFSGPGQDYGWKVSETRDSGLVMVGVSESYGNDYLDFLVIRMDSLGNLVWARSFGGTTGGGEWGYAIAATSDGGCLVAGETSSFVPGGGVDWLVVKLDPSGGTEWAEALGWAGRDIPQHVIQTTGGDYVLAGLIGTGSDYEFMVVRLDPSGGITWAKRANMVPGVGTMWDQASCVIETSDGGFVAVGGMDVLGGPNQDGYFLILKLDGSGNFLWAREFNMGGNEVALSIVEAPDGGLVVAGGTDGLGAGGEDIFVIKLDANGNYTGEAGCVNVLTPAVATPSLNTAWPTVGEDCVPNAASMTPSPTVLSPSVTDVCEPVYEGTEESGKSGSDQDIRSAPVPGGALFISPGEVPLRIYAVDGKLICSRILGKGENRISLDRGVYLWMAGKRNGKIAVR